MSQVIFALALTLIIAFLIHRKYKMLWLTIGSGAIIYFFLATQFVYFSAPVFAGAAVNIIIYKITKRNWVSFLISLLIAFPIVPAVEWYMACQTPECAMSFAFFVTFGTTLFIGVSFFVTIYRWWTKNNKK